VTTVHPGGIKTAIARNATAAEGLDLDELAKLFDKLARTSPERAAQVILDAGSTPQTQARRRNLSGPTGDRPTTRRPPPAGPHRRQPGGACRPRPRCPTRRPLR